MTTWAVLATGPSLTQPVVETVFDRCKAVAVSDAYRVAPWAEALVSTDSKWWRAHPEALEFKGRKFSAAPDFVKLDSSIERIPGTNINSGLQATMIAVKLGATRVLLCGLDLHSPGQHFFGKHPETLRSSTKSHMQLFARQFAGYHPCGVDIVNVTPGSALDCYRRGDLEEELNASLAQSSAR